MIKHCSIAPEGFPNLGAVPASCDWLQGGNMVKFSINCDIFIQATHVAKLLISKTTP